MDDRERAPDGHDHVGNGALARAAARNGSNGADPVLEEMVSTWRRRVSGNPSNEETGTDEPTVARGRAEVPGPPFANDPADVNRVPFIPQQPIPHQPVSPPMAGPPIAQPPIAQPPITQPPGAQPGAQPPIGHQQLGQQPIAQPPTSQPGSQQPMTQQQLPQPPALQPPFQPPPFQSQAAQQPFPSSAEPPPFQPSAPESPVSQARHEDESAHHFPSTSEQPAQPDEVTGPRRRSERHGYDERIRYQRPFRFRQRSDDGPQHGRAEAQFGPAESGPPEYRPPEQSRPWQPEHRNTGPEFGHHSAAQGVAPRSPAPFGTPETTTPPVSSPPPAPSAGATPPYGIAPQPGGDPAPPFGNVPHSGGVPSPPYGVAPSANGSPGPQYGAVPPGDPGPYQPRSRQTPPFEPPPPADPYAAHGEHEAPPGEPTTAFGGPPYRSDATTAFGGSVDPPPTSSFRPVHRNDGSHGATIDPPRFAGRRSVRPTSSPPAHSQPARQSPPPPADEPPPTPEHAAAAPAPPAVPAPLIPPYQGTVPPSAETAPPVVPPPLIPPVSPAADRLWAGGPWSDGSWSAGTSPSVGWQTTPVSDAGPAYAAGTADGPLPPPPPPIPSSGAFDGQAAAIAELPQRVPSAPDVPAVPGDDGTDGAPGEAPEDLSRIADFFRNEEPAEERRDGFDFPAVIDAVQGVVGVREAEIVNIDGRHTLRLDLSDDADPGEVSRAVARLLKEQMGVSAEPARPPSGAEAPVEEVGRSAPEEPDAMPVPGPVGRNSAAEAPTRRAPNAAPASTAPRGERTVEPTVEPTDERAVGREAVEPAPAVAEQNPGDNPEVTADSTPSEPAELSEQTGMSEPPELAPTSEPVPPRLADLPRVGEPPTSADSVRVGSVPGRRGLPSPRAGSRPSDARPLRARLADIEPELSFEAWLEAIRPGAPRPARNVEEHPQAEAPEEPTQAEPESEPGSEPEAEHHSLVGMPMAPVFTDPTEQLAEPEEEPAQRRDLEPVRAHREPAPELAMPNAPAFQFAGSGGRVRLEQVEVNSHGLDAEVQVRLSAGGTGAVGHAVGPAVDGYMLRLSATATAGALDALLTDPDSGTRIGRCYIEHATVVPLGTCEIALVVMLIVSGGFAEQLSGSAIVAGDVRQAVVRATLAAANRRLDALLP